MLGNPQSLGSAVVEAFRTHSRGADIQLVVPDDTSSLPAGAVGIDFSDPDAVIRWRGDIFPEGSTPVGVAVINLLPLLDSFQQSGGGDAKASDRLTTWMLNILRSFEAPLRQAASGPGAVFLNVTSLNGRMGFDVAAPVPVVQASSVGMSKTASKEWPGVQVKNLDLAFSLPATAQVEQILVELRAGDSLVEVGVDERGRWRVTGQAMNALAQPVAPLPFDQHSVILITGGANGVTAAVAERMAEECQPRLVLVGRSPLPIPEPADSAALVDIGPLRTYLIQSMRSTDPTVKPAAIERRLQRILKDREIAQRLAAIRKAGSEVEYHAVDVRDSVAFGALIDSLYAKHGRIDGVIHGAGVVEDRLIRDKSQESFSRVYHTKVHSADVLAQKLDSANVKFFVLFSSVSGRLGTAGQVDYSAANEYLNKLAAHLDHHWPGRVVAINWGPWDGGMVTEELKRLYRKQNVGLIGQVEGADCLMNELRRADDSSPEVLIAAGDAQALENYAGLKI